MHGATDTRNEATIVTDPDLLVLREGDNVAMRDVTAPQVIKAGDMITVVYEDGGIRLTLQAKALANAAAGETLNVQNVASKKIIEAVATGADEARPSSWFCGTSWAG